MWLTEEVSHEEKEAAFNSIKILYLKATVLTMLKKMIFAFKQQKGFNIILVLMLIIISGCTYIPTKTISFITSSENSLYFSMSNGKIRVLDKDTLRWNDVAIEDMYQPIIINVFNSGGNIIIQAVDYGWKNPSIYLLNEQGSVKKAVSFKETGSFATGGDADFLYFIGAEYKAEYSGKDKWVISGFRYDKKFKLIIANHFDEYPNLLVTDVWEDKEYFWFACLDSQPVRDTNAPAGNIVLIAKSKTTNVPEKFEIVAGNDNRDILLMDGTKLLPGKGGNIKYGYWDMLWVRGDADYIWLFSKPVKNAVTFLIKFSKAKRVVEYEKEFIATLIPFHGQSARSELWAVGSDFRICHNKCVYRIDKADLKAIITSMPPGINISPFTWNYHNSNIVRPFNPFYEDDNSLWIFTEQYRKVFTPSGCCVPYLVRISKKDMSYEMILVEPTVGEAFITIWRNFLGWLYVPFFKG